MDLPVIHLNHPIETPDSKAAKEIRFLRRMNGADLAAAGFALDLAHEGGGMKLTAEQVNMIASRCTGLPPACIENLDASDWVQVFGVIGSFFG